MRTFSLDMIPGGAQTAVACNQYESGDVWVFALYYDGGRYSIPQDATVSITGTKPDGAAYKIAGEIVDNAVSITVTDQITACAGRSIAEILVESETDGTTLYSANFPLLVEPAAVQGDLSSSEIPSAIVDTDGNVYYESKSILGLYPVESASGDIAVIHDGADSLPVRDLSVAIEPVQTGTGTPSPSNVRAINGWDALKVARTAQNLLPNNYTETVFSRNGITFTVSNDGVVTANGMATAGTYFNFSGWEYDTLPFMHRPGLRLRLSGSYPGVITRLQTRPYGSSTTTTIATDTGTGAEFTVPDDVSAYALFINITSGQTVTNATFHPVISVADEGQPTWSPSEAEVTNITLPTTVYGGTLDVTKGILTVDRAMVDLGSLSYTRETSGSVALFRATMPSRQIGNGATGVSSQYGFFGTGTLARMYEMDNGQFGFQSTNTFIAIRDDRYTDVDSFKTAVTGQTLVYPLAAPQTYTLTPTEVKTLLGENRIYADAGDVTVEYRVDFNEAGLSAESAAESAATLSAAIDTVDRVDTYQKLLADDIPGTTQEYAFTDGAVSTVTHKASGSAVRTDAFTYGDNTITEVRTLASGEKLTILTDLVTLATTVTYTAA